MTLAFTQTIKGEPNYFVEKIWLAIAKYNLVDRPEFEKRNYKHKFATLFFKLWETPKQPVSPKLHTIRAGKRFKVGSNIHLVINNRTKDRFQFAPVLQCKSVQEIKIRWVGYMCFIYIEDRRLYPTEYSTIAVNEGFETTADFLEFFDEDFKGQIIHFTNLRY